MPRKPKPPLPALPTLPAGLIDLFDDEPKTAQEINATVMALKKALIERALLAALEFRRMAQEREHFLLEAEMERKEAETRGQASILRRQLRVEQMRNHDWKYAKMPTC